MFKILRILSILMMISSRCFAVGNGSFSEKRIQNLDGILGIKNILSNPGAENSSLGWSASGGTFTRTTNASNTLFGNGSFSFDASATSQNVTSTQVTIPRGLYGANCMARMTYKGGDNLLAFRVVDGSSNVLATQTLVAATNQSIVTLNFTCPSSGTVGISILSSGNAANLFFDDLYIGEAFNVSLSSAQATQYGWARWPTTASCSWSTTSGSFAAFSADADCTSPTGSNLTGNASAPATKIPGISFTNLPPGDYVVIANGRTKSGNILDLCGFTLTDGTNTSGKNLTSASVQTMAPLIGKFSYTAAQSSITFSIQAALLSGSTDQCYVDNSSSSSSDLEFTVMRFPSSSQTVVSSPSNQFAPGTLKYPSAASCFFDITAGSYTSTSTDTDCTTATVTGGVNLPTTSKTAAFNVKNLPAGSYYVYAIGAMYATSSTVCSFRITDGTNTIGATHAANSAQNFSYMGGVVTYSSLQSTLEFNVQALRNSGAGNCTIDIQSPYNLEMGIIPLTPNISMPMIVNSVSSNTTGQERIERARVTCASSGSTAAAQSGSWISSVSNGTTGVCTVNITAGIFTAEPACTCTVIGAASTSASHCMITSTPSTSALALSRVRAGSAENGDVDINCMGPR